MSVFRVNATRDYTVMSNSHFRDKRLSLKAKGLLSQMLSLPESWDYTVVGLTTINKENKSAIQSALKELEETGYLVRTRSQNERGQFDYIYDIYEKPCHGEPRTENQHTVNPCTDNQPQYNTKELNTNNKIHRNKIKRFTPPTLKEVTEYCQERNNDINPQQFVDFYTSKGWKVGNSPMKDWKASVRTWEQRNTIKKPKLSAQDEEFLRELEADGF